MHIGDMRFLVVEDHEFQRRVLQRILAGLGATSVSVAADGREALDIAMAPDARVDIIISDLEMPGMDGAEFMRHLGQTGLPVAIILASALGGFLLASVEAMTRDYGVRILGVIEKPVTPAKLEALINRHGPAHPGQLRPATRGPWPGLGKIAGTLRDRLGGVLRVLQPSAPLDRSVLAVISGGDTAAERQILTDFMRGNDADAALLKLAVDRRDAAQVSKASDRIRGASRAIGAKALAATCERVEHASIAGDWKTVEANMGALHRELGRLNSYCAEETCASPN